jgi:hypothetical protein
MNDKNQRFYLKGSIYYLLQMIIFISFLQYNPCSFEMFTTLNKKFYGRKMNVCFIYTRWGQAAKLCSICDPVSQVPSCFLPYQRDEMVCTWQKYILYPVKLFMLVLYPKLLTSNIKMIPWTTYSLQSLQGSVNSLNLLQTTLVYFLSVIKTSWKLLIYLLPCILTVFLSRLLSGYLVKIRTIPLNYFFA